MPDITVDPNTFASRPGGVRLNYLQWIRCYPFWPVILLAALIGVLVATFIMGTGWYLGCAAAVVVNFLYWTRKREHFASGDTCPAVVISTSPMKLAVSTNLATNQTANHPVIKVIRVPRASVPEDRRKVGAHLATVALYSGSKVGFSWEDFYPLSVGAAEPNGTVMDQCVTRFTLVDWEGIEFWLDSNPQPKRGLHRLNGY